MLRPHTINIIPGDPYGLPDVFIIMEEAIIFIDGAYLSHISKFLGKGKHLKFKIETFCEVLCLQNNVRCNQIFYYNAPPFQSPIPDESENKRKKNYDAFIERLKKSNQILVREGRCQKINNSFSQKGVDTLITMDLLRQAQINKNKTFIIITADTDFVPIIKEIQNMGIQTILAYFTDKKRKSPFSLSNHLWKVFKNKILIKREHFI